MGLHTAHTHVTGLRHRIILACEGAEGIVANLDIVGVCRVRTKEAIVAGRLLTSRQTVGGVVRVPVITLLAYILDVVPATRLGAVVLAAVPVFAISIIALL